MLERTALWDWKKELFLKHSFLNISNITSRLSRHVSPQQRPGEVAGSEKIMDHGLRAFPTNCNANKVSNRIRTI